MYTRVEIRKLILHFDKPIEELDDREYEMLGKEVEKFERECKGRFSATMPNAFRRCRLELICEGEPELIE